MLQKLAERGFEDLRVSHTTLFASLDPSGSRLVDIAGRAGITKQSMAAIADDLEGLGYIHRGPDPRDGRARLIWLTDRGRQAVARIDPIAQEIIKEYGQASGPPRVLRLSRDLLKLAADLELEPAPE